MKTSRLLVCLLLCFSLCSALWAEEDDDTDSRWSISASGEFNSAYYWRGFDLSDHRPTFQPDATITHNRSGLWVDLWGSLPLKDRDQLGETDEFDLTFGLDRELGESVGISVGAILYFFPRLPKDEDSTQEIFGGITLLSLPLEPTVSYYHDFSLGDGGYLQLGGNRSIGNLELSAGVGFSFEQFTSKNGFTDAVLGASYAIGLGAGGHLSPYLRIAVVDDEERNPDKGEFWFGVIIGWDQ